MPPYLSVVANNSSAHEGFGPFVLMLILPALLM